MLALGAAVVFGSADFLGGLASRRRAALAVALLSQLAGLVALVTVLPMLGPATVAPRDLALGALGGLFGSSGVVLLFRSLAQGPMSVVAPVAALTASVVPILAGVIQGERPGPSALVGIAVALVAVFLITREGSGRAAPLDGAVLRVAATALAAGALFGLFFVCLHGTGDDAGLYPLLGARLASVPFLAVLLVTRGGGVRDALAGRGWTTIIASGVLDMAANVLYLVALRHGLLAVVSAVTGLYPATTVLLAQTVLDERMHRTQVAGLAVAAVAATLVAV
ncbi:DMT family transporter [Iamia sp. SCSIO 61187]|uniref:DMT family transporter n=1 Tax=Iamia sp. SCSIO 61187 TaxID=2722752 RepID=UPI0021062AF1|nr:DMT family transporter [Iamia sp. SCSIO 61187]QYG95717.1 DMT family transporter [Iamia sp. SCSIO 61187]